MTVHRYMSLGILLAILVSGAWSAEADCTFSGKRSTVASVDIMGEVPAVRVGALVATGKGRFLYVVKKGCWIIVTSEGTLRATLNSSIIAKNDAACERALQEGYRVAILNYNNSIDVYNMDVSEGDQENAEGAARIANESATEANVIASSRCVESDGTKRFQVLDGNWAPPVK